MESYTRRGLLPSVKVGRHRRFIWLRRKGHTVPRVYRALTSDGRLADGFVPAGAKVPGDALNVRDVLSSSDGVVIDALERAREHQRFSADDSVGTSRP